MRGAAHTHKDFNIFKFYVVLYCCSIIIWTFFCADWKLALRVCADGRTDGGVCVRNARIFLCEFHLHVLWPVSWPNVFNILCINILVFMIVPEHSLSLSLSRFPLDQHLSVRSIFIFYHINSARCTCSICRFLYSIFHFCFVRQIEIIKTLSTLFLSSLPPCSMDQRNFPMTVL